MIKPEIHINEVKRYDALKKYSILDTLPEKEYDDITYLASYICETPISLISLIDDKRQWFKSHHGIDAEFTPREVAFCAHAINDQENILIVPDSRKDERFFDNPLVTSDPHVIFYAGIPLVNPDGFPLGTLCVIDNKPKDLSDKQISALKALSGQLMKLFELRKNTDELQTKNFELEVSNKGLNDFARIAAHDIKSPVNNIIMSYDLLKKEYSDKFDPDGLELIDFIGQSSRKLTSLIDGILKYSTESKLLSKHKEDLDVRKTFEEIFNLTAGNKEVKFRMHIPEGQIIFTNKTAFEQIVLNLLANSLKYNNNNIRELTIHSAESDEYFRFSIIDNGPGIKDEDKERIFKLFETTDNKTNTGSEGTGIGLATVKSLVEGLGGQIDVFSEYGKGAEFVFSIKK